MAEMRVCSKCGKNRAVRFYQGTRGRICQACRSRRSRGAARNTRLQETYDITQAEYDVLLALQGFCCAGCLRKPRYNMDVDHDHKIEKHLLNSGIDPARARRASIRGLLCKPCNRKVLPFTGDDPGTLRRLANYVERGCQSPAQKYLRENRGSAQA